MKGSSEKGHETYRCCHYTHSLSICFIESRTELRHPSSLLRPKSLELLPLLEASSVRRFSSLRLALRSGMYGKGSKKISNPAEGGEVLSVV